MTAHSRRSNTPNQSGLAALEAVLIIIIVAIIGFVGWYVWHTKQATDDSLNAAAKTSQNTPTKQNPAVTSFEECEKAPGSITQQTYPEKCVTQDGKSFTDVTQTARATKYLTIKEWGVKIPLTAADAGAYYTIDTDVQQSSADPTNLTVYATEADDLTGPAGISCKGEYIAFLLRLPNNDPRWAPSTSVDDGNVSPLFGERISVGNYKYAIATKKEYGPECWETSKTGDYNPDPATSQKFEDVVTAFYDNFKNITAN